MADGAERRVGILAPMQSELEPVVGQLGMVQDGGVWRARSGEVEVLAMLTTMGMEAAARAAERMLDAGVERVIVSGVAGGVDRDAVSIGDLVVPEVLIDRRTGSSYRQAPTRASVPSGTISCGDDLITDVDRLAAMAASGIVAVDMESAAVAAVCDAAGVAWSVFRGISDLAGDPFIDQSFFELANPDGTIDPDVLTCWLDEDPARRDWLARLAPGAFAAATAAATAAIRSIGAVGAA